MRRQIIGFLVALVLSTTTAHTATLGIPTPHTTVSGIGVISGWKCHVNGELTVRFDGGQPISLLYGAQRPDVQKAGACTHDHAGFLTIWNWGELGDGTHTAVVYDDGVEFDRSTFEVVTTGEAFLRGAAGQCLVEDFPAPSEQGRFIWNQATQHMELAEVLNTSTEPPVHGQCGDNVDSCLAGVYQDRTDTPNYFRWQCVGDNGGRTASCRVAQPVHGHCGNRQNSCQAGTFNDLSDTNSHYRWECVGSDGGQTEFCQLKKSPMAIHGRCGENTDTCIAGTYQDQTDTTTHYRWICLGSDGGRNVSCQTDKPSTPTTPVTAAALLGTWHFTHSEGSDTWYFDRVESGTGNGPVAVARQHLNSGGSATGGPLQHILPGSRSSYDYAIMGVVGQRCKLYVFNLTSPTQATGVYNSVPWGPDNYGFCGRIGTDALTGTRTSR